MDRGVSDSWWRMSRIDSGVRSTNALLVIISLTYRPAPNSRQSRRKAVFVISAIGASTTGVSSGRGPKRRGAGGVWGGGGSVVGGGGGGGGGGGEGGGSAGGHGHGHGHGCSLHATPALGHPAHHQIAECARCKAQSHATARLEGSRATTYRGTPSRHTLTARAENLRCAAPLNCAQTGQHQASQTRTGVFVAAFHSLLLAAIGRMPPPPRSHAPHQRSRSDRHNSHTLSASASSCPPSVSRRSGVH